MRYVLLISILTPITALIDYVWLGVIARDFYAQSLGTLMRPAGASADIRILSALLVYVLMSTAIILFVLPHTSSMFTAFTWGACFGLILYGVYDFTNSAILVNWPWRVVLVDILWGIVLCGIVSCIAHYLDRVL